MLPIKRMPGLRSGRAIASRSPTFFARTSSRPSMASDGEAPAPEPGSARRAWQGQQAAVSDDARRAQRRVKILVVTGLLSALIAMGVVLLRYVGLPAPAPHFLAIHVAEHNHKHFPLQLFARADSELLMRHFEEGKKKEATTKTR